jgi:hypothetical protein
MADPQREVEQQVKAVFERGVALLSRASLGCAIAIEPSHITPLADAGRHALC